MRLTRASWLVLAALGGAACSHNDAVEIISRDGVNTVPAIDLNTNAAAGFLTGTRAVNRFISAGAFDTSIVDAFGRQTTNPPFFRPDPSCGYGTTSLIYSPGAAATPTYTPPQRYLPALVGGKNIMDVSGCGTAVAYIVQPGHPGNGGTVWEMWFEFNGDSGKRYISGLVRYALQQRGALDQAEILLTGTATQPDSLVFLAGDFNPGGKKARARFTTSCVSANLQHAVAGQNPIWLGSDTTGRIAPNQTSIDATISACAGEPWGNLGTNISPIPTNNNLAGLAVGGVKYNFYVIWEALADSTPDYSKPVYRQQVGPLLTTTGAILNNSYGPIPTAALTGTQLGPLPGATSRPDTMKLTFNTLKQLASGAYQVWLVKRGTDTAQLVTGRVVRLAGATVVDTLNGVSEFNTSATITGARVEFDLAPYTAAAWNSATLAIARTTGNTTLPLSQPLWTNAVYKSPGQTASLTGNLVFGSLNKGTGTLVFGAAGGGTGGVFGRELREDILRIPRPPVGYVYEAWLIGATTVRNLGPVLAPYPTLTSLVDADTMSTLPLSGTELTQAAVRYVADSIGDFCRRVGATTAFARVYDRVQIRLGPKNGDQNTVSPTIVLNGTLTMAPRVVNDSVKTCN